MATQNVVQLRDITKTYGKKGEKQYQALKGISFDVAPGEFVGIMGASGSGKTTLLNILSTLDKPTTGTVTINGTDVTKLKGNKLADFRANEIGFIFQDFNLLESLTARENIALPLALQNIGPKKSDAAVNAIAETLGISAILDSYPTEISGGQKQRVAAARAWSTIRPSCSGMNQLGHWTQRAPGNCWKPCATSMTRRTSPFCW